VDMFGQILYDRIVDGGKPSIISPDIFLSFFCFAKLSGFQEFGYDFSEMLPLCPILLLSTLL